VAGKSPKVGKPQKDRRTLCSIKVEKKRNLLVNADKWRYEKEKKGDFLMGFPIQEGRGHDTRSCPVYQGTTKEGGKK